MDSLTNPGSMTTCEMSISRMKAKTWIRPTLTCCEHDWKP